MKHREASRQIHALENIEKGLHGENFRSCSCPYKLYWVKNFFIATLDSVVGSNMEKSSNLTQMKLEKRFGQSPVFVASTHLENGGVPHDTSPASLLSEAIQVISCGYEDKTEWGKEVMATDSF